MVWCVWLIVNNFTCYHHALLLWIIFLPILCHTMESEHIGCLWRKKLIAPQPSFSPTHLISQISSLLQCGPLDFGCFRGGFRDCNLVAEKELFAPSTSSVLASHRSSPTESKSNLTFFFFWLDDADIFPFRPLSFGEVELGSRLESKSWHISTCSLREVWLLAVSAEWQKSS